MISLHLELTVLVNGSIEVRIPVLVRGEEELEEDEADGDESFYYLAEYEKIDRKDFDEESLKLSAISNRRR